MWMLESRREADFLLESLGSQGRGNFRMQDLERDRPVMAQVLRQEHGREPTSSELVLDTVVVAEGERESITRGQWMSPESSKMAASVYNHPAEFYSERPPRI
jgi:hypothetical protein